MKDSAFLNFKLLPEVALHTIEEDEYSELYIPREKCDCGCSEWIEKGCTMILGFCYGDPIYKDVHRCKECDEVRMADHISKMVKK
jgi:hypothetical protein